MPGQVEHMSVCRYNSWTLFLQAEAEGHDAAKQAHKEGVQQEGAGAGKIRLRGNFNSGTVTRKLSGMYKLSACFILSDSQLCDLCTMSQRLQQQGEMQVST